MSDSEGGSSNAPEGGDSEGNANELGQLKFRGDVVPWLDKKSDQEVAGDEDPLRWDRDEQEVKKRGSRLLVLAGVLAIVALVGAVVFALNRKGKEGEDEEVAAVDERVPSIFDVDYEELAKQAVGGFLEAESIEEKLRFVAWPTLVRPLMENYYRRHPDEPARMTEFQFISSSPSFETDETYYLANALQGGELVFYVLLDEGDRLTIDWECLVAYGHLSLKEFIEEPPAEPVKMRLKVSRADYYNYEFADESRYRSFELESQEPDTSTLPTTIYGYVEIGSYLEKQFEQYLPMTPLSEEQEQSKAKELPMLLLLNPPSKPGRGFCQIEELIRPDWSGEP